MLLALTAAPPTLGDMDEDMDMALAPVAVATDPVAVPIEAWK